MNSGWPNDTPEHSSWDPWLERHAPALLLFARQQARSEADAQDLVQDALVECARRQADGIPPPPGLVFATIRRRAIDLARREDRPAPAAEAAAYVGQPECWFDSTVEDRETTRLIQEAMQTLTALYREVVILKIWGDLTFAEIAAALEIPANTAASRYRYGLVELRKLTKEILA